MIRLPVSGLDVLLRPPGGADDLALIESSGSAIEAALALLTRLATWADGTAQDWAQLTMTDFELLLLQVRKTLVGEQVSAQVACPACAERVEISFRVSDYAAAIRPKTFAEVLPATLAGWLQLGTEKFRLPQVADILAAQAAPNPARALELRCLAPDIPPKQARRLEQKIALMAPQVTGEVGGACPECAAKLTAWFDVTGFVLTELRRLAAGIHQEVHLLAAHYHWAEAAILALPAQRRRAYAELLRDSRFAAAV
jgi:hypothetical protein